MEVHRWLELRERASRSVDLEHAVSIPGDRSATRTPGRHVIDGRDVVAGHASQEEPIHRSPFFFDRAIDPGGEGRRPTGEGGVPERRPVSHQVQTVLRLRTDR
jgi:hypothetical protein